ncbi:MAG TPA: iron-sulfur cluster repair di-iron protein [Flavisolibacter sp.]|nr:iron-sulfur cluster repair di-iron protein [Flavisolibacter sp.]
MSTDNVMNNNCQVPSVTVGQMVAADLRKAEVFKKFGIEFCCGGKKSLEEACQDAGIDLETIQIALQNNEYTSPINHRFDQWDLNFLTDYIINHHHRYYYTEAPVIEELLNKVVYKHGAAHPCLTEIQQVFALLTLDLNDHFEKEETILFPIIKQLARSKNEPKSSCNIQPFSLSTAIAVMESEHEEAGILLSKIRQLTHQYNTPGGACNSFQFLYKKLKDLDEDLQFHIHLENNLLFPKALLLEKENQNSGLTA